MSQFSLGRRTLDEWRHGSQKLIPSQRPPGYINSHLISNHQVPPSEQSTEVDDFCDGMHISPFQAVNEIGAEIFDPEFGDFIRIKAINAEAKESLHDVLSASAAGSSEVDEYQSAYLRTTGETQARQNIYAPTKAEMKLGAVQPLAPKQIKDGYWRVGFDCQRKEPGLKYNIGIGEEADILIAVESSKYHAGVLGIHAF